MHLSLVSTHIFSPVENVKGALFLTQESFIDPLMIGFKFHLALNTFRNMGTSFPPWLKTGINTTAIAHASTTITNYDVVATIGVGSVLFSILDPVL